MKKIKYFLQILVIFLFAGCANPFNLITLNPDIQRGYVPEDTLNDSGIYILTGTVGVQGAVPAVIAKTALPQTPSEIIYKVQSKIDGTVTQTIITKKSLNGVFRIGVPAQALTIAVDGYLCSTEADCSIANHILHGEKDLTVSDIQDGGAVNIIAGPLVGNGSVNLPVSVYDTSSIKSYKATWSVGGTDKEWTDNFSTETLSFTMLATGDTDIANGQYTVEFTFYSENDATGNIVYRCTECINVFSNMETNYWQAGGSIHIEGGKLYITATCLALYNRHEFFVSGTPTADGTGTYFDPVTMPEAVKFVTSLNDGSDYIIYLKDSITLGSDYTGWPTKSDSTLEKSYVTIDPSSDLKLKICSYGNPDVPYVLDVNCSASKTGRVMYIGVNADVTLEIITVKGGCSYFDNTASDKGNGAGIFIKEGKLTLENKALVTRNIFANNGGYAAGIYNECGSLLMKGGSEISYNGDRIHVANGGGLYNKGDNVGDKTLVFDMEPGSKITHNIANSGAGIKILYGADSNIHGAQITDNEIYSTNNDNGGGIWASVLANKKLEIKDTTFKNNTAICGTVGSGGAIYVQLGTVLIDGTTTFDSNEAIQGNAIGINNTTNQYVHIEGSVKFINDAIKQTVAYDYSSALELPYIKLGALTGALANQTIYLELGSVTAGTTVLKPADAMVDLSLYTENFVVLDLSGAATTYTIDSAGKLVDSTPPAPTGYYFVPKTAAQISTEYTHDYSVDNPPVSGDKVSCGSADDLKVLSALIKAGNALSGVEIILTSDLNVELDNITSPLSTSSKPFSGTFDGNGNTISGLGISSGNYVGLFGGVSNATIKNLKLSGTVTSTYSNAYTGAFAGECRGKVLIENCESSVTINAAGNNVGGFVGYAYCDLGSGDNLVIRNCVNKGSVSGNKYIGGFVGFAGTSFSSVFIENCVNKAQVTATGEYSGGIVGRSENTHTSIINCVNLEQIAGTSAGGIAGSVTGGTISNCYYLGSTATAFIMAGSATVDSDTCKTCLYWDSGVAVSEAVTASGGYVYPVHTDLTQILNDWCVLNKTSDISYYKWKNTATESLVLYSVD